MKSFKIIAENRFADISEIVSKRLCERGLFVAEDAELTLCLLIDPFLRKDSYRIAGLENNVTISADCKINLLAGCGDLMFHSQFDENGIKLTDKRGNFCPDCSARCVYTASHFNTYYWTAPIEEVLEYVEDLALMGINELNFPIPYLNLKGATETELDAAYARVCSVMKYAKQLGMLLVGELSTSCVSDAPADILATPIPDEMRKRGNTGVKVCPSNPKGKEFLDNYNRQSLKKYAEYGVKFDIFSTFPYDEGGCGCPDCDPWGAKGYIRAAKSAIAIAKETNPDAKLSVSTWLFDFPNKGEWLSLFESLKEEPWAQYIEADSHNEYPRFPLENDIPEGITLRAFPEITMWGLWPWGGYGAHFFPHRYTKIWRSTKGKLGGGRMYSEGIFEDLNKYTVAGLYKDFNADPDESVKQYGAYFFGCNDGEDFAELVRCIETNMVNCAKIGRVVISMTEDKNLSDFSLAKRALALAKKIDATLPNWGKKSFRWRLIYLRAIVDYYRYQNVILHECAPVVEAMEEIAEISHCLKNYKIKDDPFHLKLRPPLPVYDPNFRLEDYPRIGSLRLAYDIGLIRNGNEKKKQQNTSVDGTDQA